MRRVLESGTWNLSLVILCVLLGKEISIELTKMIFFIASEIDTHLFINNYNLMIFLFGWRKSTKSFHMIAGFWDNQSLVTLSMILFGKAKEKKNTQGWLS